MIRRRAKHWVPHRPTEKACGLRPASGHLGSALCAGFAAAVALAALSTGATAQSSVKAEPAKLSSSASQAVHKVAIQVNQNDKATMELALNNAKNVVDYYASKN